MDLWLQLKAIGRERTGKIAPAPDEPCRFPMAGANGRAHHGEIQPAHLGKALPYGPRKAPLALDKRHHPPKQPRCSRDGVTGMVVDAASLPQQATNQPPNGFE